jgi:hypothetical protein
MMSEWQGGHEVFDPLYEWYVLEFGISQMLECLADELHRDDARAVSGYQETIEFLGEGHILR